MTNRLTLDSEGLMLDTRAGKAGSGWVGDEYGAYIYHFNSTKQIDGQLQLPEALVPHSPVGTINFLADPPTNGRRINQGMEGIAQSPDGTKLFALLQSATIQDSGSGNQGRSNARLLVYDISATDTPDAPAKQYVIQLPLIDDNGGTGRGQPYRRPELDHRAQRPSAPDPLARRQRPRRRAARRCSSRSCSPTCRPPPTSTGHSTPKALRSHRAAPST